MDTTTQIAIFSISFLQLSVSALILWTTSSRKRTGNDLEERKKPGEDALETFRSNCLKFFLTSREIEVLQLVGEGLPYKLIACQLSISEHTVNTHIKNMFSKVGATNKMELVGRVGGNDFSLHK